jgi:hypothetical protein
MGIYLSVPSNEVFTEEGSQNCDYFHMEYAVGEMQARTSSYHRYNLLCYELMNLLFCVFASGLEKKHGRCSYYNNRFEGRCGV